MSKTRLEQAAGQRLGCEEDVGPTWDHMGPCECGFSGQRPPV